MHTTSKPVVRSTQLALLLVTSLAGRSAFAGYMDYQPFDSWAAAEAEGWARSETAPPGDPPSYTVDVVPTQNAGGNDPGEVRLDTSDDANWLYLPATYYADVDLNGELESTSPLSFSARLRIDGFDSTDLLGESLVLGFFGSPGDDADYMGICFNEGKAGATVCFSYNGGGSAHGGCIYTVPVGRPFDASFSWDPQANKLTLTIDGDSHVTSGSWFYHGLNVDSFGFYVPSGDFTTWSSQASFYLDDVHYSIVPEPAAVLPLALGACLPLLRRRR